MAGREGAERKELSPAKAALLEKWRQGRAAAPAPRAIPRGDGPAPLSSAQERLWFLHRLDPTSPAYNMYVAHRLRGALDVATLQRALSEIVRRHESLRTTFADGPDGAPVTRVQPPAPVPLPVRDLQGVPPDAREARLRATLDEEALAPIDLAAGPLLRALLVRLAPEDHALLVVVHHVAFDERSESVFCRELGALYAAHASGAPSHLPELPIQYGDFARWQKARLARDEMRAPLARWKERLQGVAPLELPTDRPRPPQPTFAGRMQTFHVPAQTAEGLRALARAEGATLHMTLLAAFQAFLHRHARQDDVAVGSPVSGRESEETEALIGFFVNTLVLRADCSGDPTFRELLQRTRATCLDAYGSPHVPFDRLVDELHPERDPSRSPLFQAFFALQNAITERLTLPGLDVAPMWVHSPTSKFDVSLFVLDEPPALRCWLETSADLFDEATARAFVDRFLVLLAGVAATPDARLGDLPLATADESRRALVAWNDTARELPAQTALARILAQARATPDAPAVVFEGERMTYAQLDARSAAIAARVREAGAGQGDIVALLLDRGLDLPVALVGIMRSGAAYLPLDPSYPAERIATMLADSGARLVVTRSAPAELLPPQAAIVDLDALQAGPHANLALPRPDDLAYVIYTSGSTGKPKGTLVEHASLLNLLVGMQDLLAIAPGDRWLSVTTPSFDIAALELLLPLMTGGCVEVASRETTRDPRLLLARLADATVMQATPSTWRMLVDGGWTRRAGRPLQALCGGEPLTPALAQALVARADKAWNVYGPTETTIWSTAHLLRAEDSTRVPIGRPLANTRVYVVDEELRPVPPGVVGELCIGGAGVARGYLGRPELTAERFVPDPRARNERVYRTGDLARWLPDGTLECLGRVDRQVKLRGHRIELGEIEAALAACPDLEHAAVDMRPGPGGEPRLVAWVVPRALDAPAPDAAAHAQRWRPVFDARAEGADVEFDTSVWTSSFTGEPIPQAEMREWVDATVARILALRPRRILEIGVGSGLLMWRLAPACERYVGTDISGATLDRLRSAVAARGLTNVSLHEAEAARTDLVPEDGFDVVILNSVAQYFPDVDHLVRVVQGAAAKLRDGLGALFLGDLRSLPLLPHFHEAAGRRAADEAELVLHPAVGDALAARLPDATFVQVAPREGRLDNEMNRYRYDIIIRLGEAPPRAPVGSWMPWAGVDDLRARLRTRAAFGLRAVPNARIVGEGLAPADLHALAEEAGLRAQLSWAAGHPDGAFDVAFVAGSALVSDFPRAQPPAALANEPARERARREREAALFGTLRDQLARVLPEPMLPSAYVALPALPLTPNGKVDRKALPTPDAHAASAAEFVAPRTATERALAELWRTLLGVTRVGTRDGFFALGGHSLLATQMVSRVRDAMGVELPLRRVFASPTLEGLAAAIDEARAAGHGADAGPTPVPARQGLPLTAGQERLWFLHQLDPTSPAYNVAFARRLRGPLDVAALERALGDLVARHEALRTTVALAEGAPVLDIRAPAPVALPLDDVSNLPEREAAAAARVADAAHAPFDLVRGPLFRARLVRLAPDHHVLLLAMHHIAFDEWSERTLLRDLAALYAARARGEAPPLPAPALQFGDAAAWLRARDAAPETLAQVARWRARLEGLAPLELPLDRARPTAPRFRGRTVRVPVSCEAAEALRALARAEGATPFMALAAVMQEWLRRQTGQEDVALAAPIAGRGRKEMEDVVGFFVNTLALRGDLSGAPSLRTLVRRAKAASLDAFGDQDAPFSAVVDALGAPRDVARPPLAQVALVLHQEPTPLALYGLDAEPFPIESRVARFDITLWASDARPEEMALECDADLFEAATMERFAERLARLVAVATAAPDTPLAQLDALPSAERALVADAWTGRRAPYPEESVHALFEAQARRAPDGVALVADNGARVTYAQLDARAGALASALRDAGAAPGDLIATCLPRGVDAIASQLAILKVGATYLPLDAESPPERLAALVADAGARLALATSALAVRLPATVRVVAVEGVAEGAAFASARVSPDAAAYVMYTSGSTGKPKGVVVPHRAIARLVFRQDYVRFADDEVFLHYAPAAFDASTFEVWGALLHGAAVALAPPRRLAAHELAAFLRERGVTTAWLTAPLFHLMVDEALDGLAGLRQLVAGGDALSVSHVRRARDALPGLRLVNGYGPTESTTFACCHVIEGVPRDARSIPIGRPLVNTRALVLGPDMQPAPVGVAGEIYLGGDGLALGYFGRPDLTSERFVAGPNGERLYRTGDRARWRPDGALEFLGRFDDQVKIRGYRVEPGEVEAVLDARADVGMCAVVARPDPTGGKRLVAYVAPARGAAIESAALRADLRAKLPDHLVPAAIVVLDALPLRANGKVDRSALPEPAAAPSPARVAPAGGTQARLAAIWRAVLRVEPGATDDFFALGGNSLLATRVVARIRQALGVDLPLPALFHAPTVERLAREVDALRAAGRAGLPPIDARVAPGEAAPLSPGQERLWFLHRWSPGSAAYHNAGAFRLRGKLDPDALRVALEGVLARHDALRTCYPSVEGRPEGRVAPPTPPALPVEDVATEADAQRHADEHARAPFDLAQGPVCRFRLLRLAHDDHMLLVAFHHIVFDGWSVGVLARELREGYAAAREGRAARLARPSVQYADFAHWQREVTARGGPLDARVEAWRARLEGLRPLDLPTDHARPPRRSERGRTLRVPLAAALLRDARALALREGATEFMALLAAFQTLLHRYTGAASVAVGSPVSGRGAQEAEGLIGFFVNTLVLRADCSGDPTFREMLARVRESCLQAYADADVPFDRLVEALQPERDPSRTPLVQAMFSMQEPHALDLGEELRAEEIPCETGAAKTDLSFAIETGPAGAVLAVEYTEDLFEEETARRIASHYVTLLSAALAAPETPLGALPLLAEEERGRIETWGRQDGRRVLDANLQPVPIGIPGEIFLAGPPLHRTGERGRWRPDGTLEGLGRVEDHAKRAELQAERPRPPRAFVAPGDATQERLAAIFADVLGAPRVGADDDFFDLGGHSLLVARVVARVRAEMQVELPLSAVFEAPTVAKLAGLVAERRAAAGPGIRRASREAYRVRKEGSP